MTTFRFLAAGAAVTAIGLTPFGTVSAGNDSSPIPVLAEQAAALVSDEIDLLTAASSGSPEVQTALAEIDRQGHELLRQLDSYGVELTEPVRISLNLLPDQTDAVAPPAAVYAAAIADLERLAVTPDAYLAPEDDAQSSHALLFVAGAAVLVFVAVGWTQLRRPQAHAELEAMAWSDDLTGVANRRRLDRDLAHHAVVAHGPTSVIMVDVDRFKAINDTYGHVVGDRVLSDFGRALSGAVRQGDLVYRYGGEEFCVLLPNATQDEAAQVADRIVSAAHDVELPNGSHITVSAGVAHGAPSEVGQTLAGADRAMLSAKHTGRDRVGHAGAVLEHA